MARVLLGYVRPFRKALLVGGLAQESVCVMSADLERALGALRTVKASGAEDRERERLHRAAREAWRGGVRAAWWQSAAGNTGGLAIQLHQI